MKREANAVRQAAFCMSTRDSINESLFTEPCNDYGFVVFHSRDAVDLFVERVKKYRDATYGKRQGEPL